MARRQRGRPLPACYALVIPGLESVAADEITVDFGGDVKRTGPGLVVFRVPEIHPSLLELRTTEDLFLLAWGTDQLSYRAADLERIRHWTAREPNWPELLRIHQAVRPRRSGRPTYHLVAQMTGTHGYRRVDALRALAEGLRDRLPSTWRPAEENAGVEVWLTIHGATAVCGLRLSDRTMRHRTYKREHLPASLRPTLAAAMVRLANAGPGQTFLDPTCGAGTILAEETEFARAREQRPPRLLGGDRDGAALRAASANVRRLARVSLLCWDATRLPLVSASIDRAVANLPFGKQIGRPEEIGPLYEGIVAELDRTLRAGGRAVLLVHDWHALQRAARAARWNPGSRLRVRVLGQMAFLTVWEKDRCQADQLKSVAAWGAS